ncbi:MAG: hypothetical protein JWP91_2088 [Fibrobacteres bacterium]|nr:hypothetical protein [Fibrobacterota bacterium]
MVPAKGFIQGFNAIHGRVKAIAIGMGVLAWMTAPAFSIPTTVHPAFDIKELGLPDKYRTMGIDFLSDGRMVLVTTGTMGGGEVPNPDPNSCVFIVSGATGTGTIQVSKIASDFRQPSGVNVVNDKIYVSDRDAFYSIPSNAATGDPAANRTKILAWPMGAKWHQWIFTPIFSGGKFYAPYSGSIRVGGPSDVVASSDYSGAFLRWDPDGKNLEKWAGGLRSPNGAGMNDAGEMFVMDNQGSWLPGCTFMHIKQGRFYGHRQSPPQAPNWAEKLPYQPPAVWIPYPSQIAGASNSQPVYVSKGPYAGQWFGGDANGPGLTRFALEKVNGDYQGAIFRFSNATGASGINRMAWGPDGALYLGSMEHFGNWPGNGLMPFYKMTPKASGSVFEMLAVHSFKDGFEIEFTEPVSKTGLAPANFNVTQWHYTRGAAYGCCKDAVENRTVSGVQVSDDGKRVFLQISGLKAMEYVVDIKLTGVKPAAGTNALWDNETWYTLNAISDRTWNPSVGLSQRLARTSPLSSGFKVGSVRPGALIVDVDLAGDFTLALRTMDGSLVEERSGSGPGKYPLSRGNRSQGVYLLELRQGGDSFARPVLF